MNYSIPPRFSIVIPTYQRPDGLHNCLEAIAALPTLESGIEVMVVDDGSSTNSSEVTEPFKAELDLTLIRQENQGPASARNAGARLARGDYLVFVDDDCVPGPHWLERFDSRLHDEPRLAVGGPCRNTLVGNIYSAAQQMLMDYLYDHYNSDPDHARFCPSNNLVVPRQAFLDMGGFDTTFRQAGGEDRDFSFRWIENGGRLVFIPDALVHHMHHMGFWAFMKLHIHYGRGSRQFHRKGLSEGVARGFESARFYAGLITFPFSQTKLARATVLCLLQAISQFVHAGGYLAESVWPNEH